MSRFAYYLLAPLEGEDARPTVLTDAQAVDVLAQAADAEGISPTADMVRAFGAVSALETARWAKMYGFNWGNVKRLASAPGVVYLPTAEYLSREQAERGLALAAPATDGSGEPDAYLSDGHLHRVDTWEQARTSGGAYRLRLRPSHAWAAFAAWPDALTGARAWLRFLSQSYPRASAAGRRGDTDAMVAEMKDGGYFTAGLRDYQRGVARHASELASAVDASPYVVRGGGSGDAARLLGWGALVGALYYLTRRRAA